MFSRGRYKIKTNLIFYKKPEILSLYTLKNKDSLIITVGHVEIVRFDGIKQDDGSYEYSKKEYYSKFLNYGLLSTDTHFDESEDKIKYSNLH